MVPDVDNCPSGFRTEVQTRGRVPVWAGGIGVGSHSNQCYAMRQLIRLAGILAWLLMALPVEGQEPTQPDRHSFSDYFRSLTFRESPFAPHKGIHRISPERAAEVNHFRFEYDQNGRIAEITFGLGDRLRRPNHRGRRPTRQNRLRQGRHFRCRSRESSRFPATHRPGRLGSQSFYGLHDGSDVRRGP